jgi:outer membrane protein OmpA-like peptidoglycan-associated protein
MEGRLGHDFSRVRVHADERAAASARAVTALAYTVGRDVVFDSGHYAPNTLEGRRLLAHELAHVVQQDGSTDGELRVAPADSPHEREADAAAGSAVAPTLSRAPAELRRKLSVKDPDKKPAAAPADSIETNESAVRGYVANLCPNFSVLSGQIFPSTDKFCPWEAAAATSFRHGCTCLCSLQSLDETWLIAIDDANWPSTDEGSRTVNVFSPYGGIELGAWSRGAAPDIRGPASAQRTAAPGWLVLGHELCGHALLLATGVHPAQSEPEHGGLPSHDVTIQIENRLAAEHGVPASQLRGEFRDPHHGGGFGRVTLFGFAADSSDVGALPADELDKLDHAAKFIATVPTSAGLPTLVDVVGHSAPGEAVGADVTRASNVKNELVARGVDAKNFRAVTGLGDTECLAAGVNPFCRKVDIFLLGREGASLEHTEPEPPGPGDFPPPPEGSRAA